MSRYKIAVIGDRDSVTAFKALGLETVSAASAEEAKQALRALTRGGDEYAIIYITEELAAELSEEIAAFKDAPIPAVILIPSKRGTLGLGMSALIAAAERAAGARIL